MAPSQYFRRQIHACFWFERQGIAEFVAALGHEHLMFETDFPHPTCTFPDSFDYAAEALAGAPRDGSRRSWAATRPASTGSRCPPRTSGSPSMTTV